MNDQERAQKLEQAVSLIREVEFSYPYGDPTRHMIYSVIVDSFSLSRIGSLITFLKRPKPEIDGPDMSMIENLDKNREQYIREWGQETYDKIRLEYESKEKNEGNISK